MTRLNQSESCYVCGRRADGMAVGKMDRLAFYCSECGVERAKEALAMGRKLDEVEKRAAKRVAELCGTSVTLEPKELPDFIAWTVEEFAKAMRAEVEGGVPF